MGILMMLKTVRKLAGLKFYCPIIIHIICASVTTFAVHSKLKKNFQLCDNELLKILDIYTHAMARNYHLPVKMYLSL